MFTRAQIISFIQGRIALLDGTAEDITYLRQAAYAAEIIKVRGDYAQRINSPGFAWHERHLAAFDAKQNALGVNLLQEMDDLMTSAQNAGTENLRTQYLEAAYRWAQIAGTIIYDVVGGDDTW